MKFNYLIKFVPLLSSLALIIFLSFSNQKHTTKIKILIWETPSVSLGKYLALSIASGFIFSYLITNKLSNLNKPRLNKVLKTKADNIYEESDDNVESNIFNSYDNTLIERDIKEPSPTINARFRVIGKTSRINLDSISNNFKNIKNKDNNEVKDKYYYQQENDYESKDETKSTQDWNDQSFLNW
mgnify:CR=1 FL=1|tara:strand:+ start:62 stop:613 length:552 start_codon:yes stop_codon:yes gene_type:complete